MPSEFTTATSCDRHGDGLTSYVVCEHVSAGAAVAHVLIASRAEIGELLCAECEVEIWNDPEKIIERCVLGCAPCCEERWGEAIAAKRRPN